MNTKKQDFSTNNAMFSATQEKLTGRIIHADATVREAMRLLNNFSGGSMTLFVTDANNMAIGSVTDGDIRRALISGKELNDSVELVMNRRFLHLTPGDDMPVEMAKARKLKIDLLPVLEKGKIIDIIDLRKTKTCLPLEAVLMAGGRGERLRPLTDNMPKPLLPVDSKPVIDYNVEELENCGIRKIYGQ